MANMQEIREKTENNEISAVLIHHPAYPAGYKVGIIYSDDEGVAQRIAETFNPAGMAWRVEIDHIENAPDFLGEDFEPHPIFSDDPNWFAVAGRGAHISYEDYAFGVDVPILVVTDGYYELEAI